MYHVQYDQEIKWGSILCWISVKKKGKGGHMYNCYIIQRVCPLDEERTAVCLKLLESETDRSWDEAPWEVLQYFCQAKLSRSWTRSHTCSTHISECSCEHIDYKKKKWSKIYATVYKLHVNLQHHSFLYSFTVAVLVNEKLSGVWFQAVLIIISYSWHTVLWTGITPAW